MAFSLTINVARLLTALPAFTPQGDITVRVTYALGTATPPPGEPITARTPWRDVLIGRADQSFSVPVPAGATPTPGTLAGAIKAHTAATFGTPVDAVLVNGLVS